MINTNRLFKAVKLLIEQAQQQVVRNVNTVMLLSYFQIGRMIVEDEQKGTRRAGYAKETIKNLSRVLTKEFGRGYSVDNLERFRKFFLLYQDRKSASVMRKSSGSSKSTSLMQISKNMPGIFTLSWVCYVQLLKIEDANECNFYEIEAAQNNWSVWEFNAALKKQLK
ncbi:MAG: hypothetical protein KF746_05700 [Chitinophagaceae bacterium]|nr:hypothetical protein [Chitinophagaceae bacterium]